MPLHHVLPIVFPVLYLDPGSGSFIIQLLLGAGLGLIVGAKIYWSKIKSFVTGKKSDPVMPIEESDETQR